MSSSSSSGSLSTADIVGIVIGGVLGLTTVIGLIFSVYAMCCKKQNQGQVWPQQQYPYYPPNGPYGQPTNTGYYGPPTNNKSSIGSYEQPPAYSSANTGSNNYAKY